MKQSASVKKDSCHNNGSARLGKVYEITRTAFSKLETAEKSV